MLQHVAIHEAGHAVVGWAAWAGGNHCVQGRRPRVSGPRARGGCWEVRDSPGWHSRTSRLRGAHRRIPRHVTFGPDRGGDHRSWTRPRSWACCWWHDGGASRAMRPG